MEIIYIDSLFLMSLLTDYLLCLISAALCGLYLKRRRYLLAALLGAAYSVAVFLPGLSFLAAPAVKLGSALLMGLIAFGAEDKPLRCTGVFLAVSASFGGALWALDMSLGKLRGAVLPLCFLLCYLGLSLLARVKAGRAHRARLEVELGFLGRSCRFYALSDSGNCLRDPMTGARVMVVSPTVLRELFGELAPLLDIDDPVELLQAADKTELRGRLRLVPYSALGVSGMLPMFRPEVLRLDGRERKELLAAISKSASGEGFQGIV